MFRLYTISTLFLTFPFVLFLFVFWSSTIILCVFIETDDSCKETQLHRSSRSDVSFAGRSVFDYFRTFARARKHEATTATLPPRPSRYRIGETNRCFMNLQRMSRSVVSWNSALQTDPHRFAAICNHRSLHFLTLIFILSLSSATRRRSC